MSCSVSGKEIRTALGGAPRFAYREAMSETFTSLVDAFKNVGVSKAYGPPVQIGGEELVPVAVVSFGFGGGNAEEGGPDTGASGGGGGGFVLPIGVYSRNARGLVEFKPNTLVVLAGLVPVVCAVGLAIRGVLRSLRP